MEEDARWVSVLEARGLRQPYIKILSLLVNRLLEKFGENLVSVVLYGSAARGEARRDSDVDLLLVVRGLPRGAFKRQELFIDVEDSFRVEIEEAEKLGYYIDFSPILKTPEEAERISPLYLDMVEDAVILFDKDGFFEGVLRRLGERLRELGAERIRLRKSWYWRLKKDYKFGDVIEL